MAKKTQDLFMQWMPIASALHASDTSTLVEKEITTGLSIRGNYAWLIHTVEWYVASLKGVTADVAVMMALSTQQGETTIPLISDLGVICRQQIEYVFTTSGMDHFIAPMVWNSLPPTIVAAPKLSLYCVTGPDQTALDGAVLTGRIGFTTVPLDWETYREVAETFEQL